MKRIGILSGLLLGFVLLVGSVLSLSAWKHSRARQTPELPAGAFGSDAVLQNNGLYDFTVPLNDYWSEGVAPEENAAIPLLRLRFGGPEQQIVREWTLKELGQSWDPAHDVSPEQIAVAVSRMEGSRWSQLLTNPPRRPWEYMRLSPADRKLMQRWVDEQAELFVILKEASSRPKIFLPFVNWDSGLPLYRKQLGLFELRYYFSQVLSLAAVAELERGNVDVAIDHVLTAQRLWRRLSEIARIRSSWSFYQDFDKGTGVVGPDISAIEATETLLLSRQLSEEQLSRLLHGLESLSSDTRELESLDTVERLAILDRAIGGCTTELDVYRTLETGNVIPLPRQFWIPRSFNDLMAMFAPHVHPFAVDNPDKLVVELHDLFDQSVENLGSAEDSNHLPEYVKLPTESRNLPLHTNQWLTASASNLQKTRYVEKIMNAQVGLLKLGLHLEIFRLKHGRLPGYLSELDDEVPSGTLATFNFGYPLQYKVRGDDFLLRLFLKHDNSDRREDNLILTTTPADW